ncbi:hypothetical protein RFW18_15770 [Metabacillus idriensis]|uniref:hypothetical protein n=1 Tax=Metabacillus idriensis TaxID=324768 RepID=UPI0028131C92|nr:hypothetical protein [Metabacillus idriensis]MDR0139211.1 hypothetical protein [Metabacillus idriensis]
MPDVSYKPVVESEVKVNNTYSICIDKCIKYEDGEEKEEQVVLRYKKDGVRIPRQPAFNEISVTEAIISAYKKGVFSREALEMMKKGISEIK